MIPLLIWIPRGYPSWPPVVFVSPGPNVPIRATPTVQHNGLVVAPIIHNEWNYQIGLLRALKTIEHVISTDIPFFPETGRLVQNGNQPQASPLVDSRPLTPTPKKSNPTPNMSVTNDLQIERLSDRLALRYAALLSQQTLETNCLLEENKHLSQGDTDLRRAISELSNELQKVEAVIEKIRENKSKLQRIVGGESLPETKYVDDLTRINVDPISSFDDVSIDKSIINYVNPRLRESIAEDMAITDTIQRITEVLMNDPDTPKNSISMAMRTIRSLARDQFFARALYIRETSCSPSI